MRSSLPFKSPALLLALVSVVLGGFLVRRAMAEVVTNVRIPMNFCLPSPCTGEMVALEGTMHLVMRTTTSGSGNVALGVGVDTCGVSGTGLLSGAKYISNENIEESMEEHPGKGPLVITKVTNHEFIRSGSALQNDDFKLHITWHITMHDGVVTSATVDNMEIHCK
jgi:hypothetical protein